MIDAEVKQMLPPAAELGSVGRLRVTPVPSTDELAALVAVLRLRAVRRQLDEPADEAPRISAWTRAARREAVEAGRSVRGRAEADVW